MAEFDTKAIIARLSAPTDQYGGVDALELEAAQVIRVLTEDRDRLREALKDVLARDSGWSPAGRSIGTCNCINFSRRAEIEYEAGRCPHQRATEALRLSEEVG